MNTKEIEYLQNNTKFYISKLCEIFNGKNVEDSTIRLILLKNNKPVLSKSLIDLHKSIKYKINLIEEAKNHKIKSGTMFYISELIKIFETNHLDNIDKDINLMLLHDERIVVLKSLIVLPKLILKARIENIISNIENQMHADGGFFCIQEYENWLRVLHKDREPVLDIFDELKRLKIALDNFEA